jgi:hypothetical protein
MIQDPGLMRTIEKVELITEKRADTVTGEVFTALMDKRLHLSCGHVRSTNLFFMSKVGALAHCLQCLDEGRRVK